MANEGSISWAAHLGGAVTGRVRIYSTKYNQLNFEHLGRECFKIRFTNALSGLTLGVLLLRNLEKKVNIRSLTSSDCFGI